MAAAANSLHEYLRIIAPRNINAFHAKSATRSIPMALVLTNQGLNVIKPL
jgi:hypothetical protein